MKKYILTENHEPSMAPRQFRWQLDGSSNAVLTWEWPANRLVKLMLVFESDSDNDMEIERLLRDNHPHEVITRDLAARFSAQIPDGRRKYLACPAYFDSGQSVVVYKPAFVTDWLYKKTVVTAAASYKQLPLSRFKQVTLRVTPADISQVPLICRVMSYVIHERGRDLGRYPLDTAVMAGAARFYIKKDQAVKFVLDDGFAHLLDVRSR